MRSPRGWPLLLAVSFAAFAADAPARDAAPLAQAEGDALSRQCREAMLKATRFMVEKVSTRGGYLWRYLPDLSRRWGEMEAYATQIAVQPPGTPSMGHVFLDAYHVTGDETYYRAAEQARQALVSGQLPSGGWHYFIDFAGKGSLDRWYDTIGRNGWRLEEHQRYYGNATFDDRVTVEATRFLLRMYLEKRDPAVRPPLDKALGMILESQYPNGGWPQRYPPLPDAMRGRQADYTSFVTFNDDVIWQNIQLLLRAYLTLRDPRFLEAARRGMDVYLLTQLPAPQAGWAEQYTLDLEPAAARTYEPAALRPETTAEHILLLIHFSRLTGERKYLARIPEALDWLERCRLPHDLTEGGRYSHPTLVELGAGKPLFVHRVGSNVVNGRYFTDHDPRRPIIHCHHGGRALIEVSALLRAYTEAAALSAAEATKGSPLVPGAGATPMPWDALGSFDDEGEGQGQRERGRDEAEARQVIAALDRQGRWLSRHEWTSHPYAGNGGPGPAIDTYATTYVGDETDTSPFGDASDQEYVSTDVYARNMGILMRVLRAAQSAAAPAKAPATATTTPASPAPLVWRLESLESIAGHPLTVWGAPTVVVTEYGPALQFDGVDDAILVPRNPVEGLAQFTLEVLFKQAGGGLPEERFVHIQEQGTERRVMVETRVTPAGQFALDTFVLGGPRPGQALLDMTKLHPIERWHWAALVFDGRNLRHYVDGVEELAANDVTFTPLSGGQTSFGARQNKVSWYKGLIRELRVQPVALAPADLQRPSAGRGTKHED